MLPGRIVPLIKTFLIASMLLVSTSLQTHASTALAAPPAVEKAAFDRAESLSTAFRIIADRVQPSVVRVLGYNATGHMSGSGFVIREDGFLLTNNHVVEPAERLFVEFTNGDRYPAQIVGTDPLTDIALLRIDQYDLTPLAFVDDNTQLEIGDWVIAVGCPLGLDQTVTTGIISAKNRRLGIIGDSGRAGYEDFIQTDAAINKGNSGGPLINLRGKVIGVNSAIMSQTGGSDGLGFAIPADLVQYIAGKLLKDGQVRRGYLGVGIQNLTSTLAKSYELSEDQVGVLVKTISPELPAGNAGIIEEDIIVSINDVPMENTEHLRNFVAMQQPGATVAIDILRNGLHKSFDVTLGEMPTPSTNATTRNTPSTKGGRLGFILSDVRDGSVVIIDRIIPGGLSDFEGLKSRDLVTQVNGKDIQLLAESENISPARWLALQAETAPSGTILRMDVSRPISSRRYETNYERFFIAIQIP